MRDWFTIDRIDGETYIISEYRHWEETHCYLLIGTDRALLIDTGLGISDIRVPVAELTDKQVTAVATHVHWDHVGGHKYFPEFYIHEAELDWVGGHPPLPLEVVKRSVLDRCDLPDGFDIDSYQLFQGKPARVLRGGETIEMAGRQIKVLHTPGHAPGHMCFWEEERGYLFTGDLVYKSDVLYANYPSTNPEALLTSMEKVAELAPARIFPGHHTLDIQPEIIIRMRDALRQLRSEGRLRHGGGRFDFGDWGLLI